MADRILGFASSPMGRTMLKGLGVKPPPILSRTDGPWTPAPLAGKQIVLGSGPTESALTEILTAAGAQIAPSAETPDRLVFDGTGIETVEGLRALYEFFHPRVRNLAHGGRALLVGRAPGTADGPGALAARQALVGFTKSLAKEIGRKGQTANLLFVGDGAALAGPVRYLLSDRAAFVSGQTLEVGPADADEVWNQPLAGKKALVTGAARGIGAVTAKRLAEEGAEVFALDIPSDQETLEATCEGFGGHPVPVDITAPDATDKILAATGGPLDIAIQNAGVIRDRTLAKMEPAQWDLTLAVNLEAVHRVSARLLAEAGLRDGGRLVLISSIAGIAGNAGQTNYATTKAGVIGLTQGFACEAAPRQVTVNAVAPGFIETRMTESIPVVIREAGRRMCNLKQGGLPIDIADAITFFASPGAAGVTGQVLRVCGGSLVGT